MNLFKMIKREVISRSSEHYTVDQIHNEFDSASERLLNEAKEIVSKEINTSNGERLKKLGFNVAKQTVESENTIEIKKENERLRDDIEYFKQWYPFNKFITEKEIKRLCEKYKLVFGEVSDYKGEVPEKNISEIERFVLREEDKNKYGYFKRSENDENCWEPCEKEDTLAYYGYLDNYYNYRRGGKRYSDNLHFHETGTSYRGYVNDKFMICAPEIDFDMTSMRIKDGYMLVKDPIVLKPVKGGYLIVSKWGLEASDEIVANEKDN